MLDKYSTHEQLLLAIVAIVRSCGSQKAAAEHLGVSPQYLSDVLMCRRDIGAKLAKNFGLRPCTIYVPIDEAALKEKEFPNG